MTIKNIVAHYAGVIEPWKVRLMVGRAKKLRLPPDQWEDIVQELSIEVASFKYDPSNNNGAAESTALTCLIDRRLIDIVRMQSREREVIQNFMEFREAVAEPQVDDTATVQLPIDVHMVIDTLPASEKELCGKLMEGNSIEEIARQQGHSWHTIKRVVVRIRDHFNEYELGEYIGVFGNE